jgi:hypothetical protein
MTTDLACATLVEWLRAERSSNMVTPALVVRLTSNGFVCEAPTGFIIDETGSPHGMGPRSHEVTRRDQAAQRR